MKKISVLFCLIFLLAGCGSVETFETLGNVEHERSESEEMAQIRLLLAENATEILENGENILYLYKTYTVMTCILPAGDLHATVQELSGYGRDMLSLVESGSTSLRRYDWVWTAASDEGDLVCRACVLDDSQYHYCLCVMAPAEQTGELSETWNGLFSSFTLV